MNRRLANILAFLLPALLAYRVGLLALGRHLVDWNSLAAASHAFDVFHKLPQANMALIGFVQPPLPALLYLPLAYLFPQWLASGYAALLLGAVFLGLSALMLVHLGQALGLKWWLIGLVTAAFAVHPLVLSYAALGHPALILIFSYLGLAKGLTGWHKDQTVRDLIAAAIYGAASILIAYEAVVPVLAASLFILGCCRRSTGSTPPLEATGKQAWTARAEGTLITFLLPAAYVAGVWLIANWAIMGGAGYFWRMTLAGTERLSVSPVDTWLQPLLIVAFTVQPLLLALLYHDLRYGGPPRLGTPVAWLALAGLFSPLLFPTLRTAASGAALWGPLMPLAAAGAGFGFPLLLTLAGTYASTAATERRKLVSAGFVIILAGGLLIAYHLQTQGMGMPTGFRSTLTGYAASGHTDTDERHAAETLHRLDRAAAVVKPTAPGLSRAAKRSYIAGWPGFAIALYRAGLGELEAYAPEVVLPTNEPPPGDLGLEEGSVLVLLSNGHSKRAAWEARLPRYLALAEQWRSGKWTGYQVVLRVQAAPRRAQ